MAPQIVWVCFGWKIESSGTGFEFCLHRACSGGARPRKSRQNSTKKLSITLYLDTPHL